MTWGEYSAGLEILSTESEYASEFDHRSSYHCNYLIYFYIVIHISFIYSLSSKQL